MTNSTPELGEPRWHPDPSGEPGLRWWDGTEWTDRRMDTPAAGPVTQPPLADATPVYTVQIWAIALLPLLTLFAIADEFAAQSIFGAGMVGPVTLDPALLFVQAVSLVIYAASIVLALFDYRALQRAGYLRPFHWAWTFITPGAYVVGRSIVVKRRIGRGYAPMWLWIAVVVGGIIVTGTRLGL